MYLLASMYSIVMVGQVYAIFDTLVLMVPVMICLKLMLQNLATENSPWDKPLQGELLSQSKSLLYSLVQA